MSLRILVTGSRNWNRPAVMTAELFAAIRRLGGDDRDVTIVHGGARGADACADKAARAHEWAVEVHPADWSRHGRAAGPIRNREMVAAGADLCLAFPVGPSPGTSNCVALARAAGIPVVIHGEVTTS